MLVYITKVSALFSKEDKRKVLGVFLAVLVMGILEVLGVASIAPFTAVASNPELIQSNSALKWLYDFLELNNANDFLIVLGVLVLIFITLSNLFAALTMWVTLQFTNLQGHRLSEKIFKSYLMQPYVFFLNRNSAELSKNIFSEVGRVVVGVLSPGMQVLAKGVVTLFVLILLLIADPILTCIIFSILGGFYVSVFMFIRRKVARFGELAVQCDAERYQAAGEAFGGVKEIKLGGFAEEFIARYSKPSESLAKYNASSQVMSQLPRYFLEIIAFGSILVTMLYLLVVKGSVSSALPLIALYTFAGYRLLPALQQIFNGMATIRYNLPALDLLYEDIRGKGNELASYDVQERIVPQKGITLKDIKYAYPGESKVVLNSLNLHIEVNATVGLIGSTGAGKTTVLDTLLGLLEPDQGGVYVDDELLTPRNMKGWQASLGYVPQFIFLIDNTIASNIAFGVADREIDIDRVEKVCRMACLHDFITMSLSDGYDTIVGENGVRLSGGQRQRIGIARALYHNPSVLVLDEATSALDSRTEKTIMNEIYTMSEKKTVIIVAHRLATVEQCDIIYFLDQGTVLAKGSFQELLKTCEPFRKLANISE